MTTLIDDMLSRARLVQEPYTQADIEAAEQRLRERLNRPSTAPHQPRKQARAHVQEAADGLSVLCETALMTTGLQPLETFLAEAMPHPLGARALACALHLAGCGDDARFWWQYAAGADDMTATYCLYLHHLALAETAEADFWRAQITDAASSPRSNAQPLRTGLPVAGTILMTAADTSLSTLLRVLRILKLTSRPRLSAAVSAVLDYLPLAVTYVDPDIDLPLPEPGFPRRIRRLAGTAETSQGAGADPRPLTRRETRHPAVAERVAARTHLPDGSRVVSIRQEGLRALAQ